MMMGTTKSIHVIGDLCDIVASAYEQLPPADKSGLFWWPRVRNEHVDVGPNVRVSEEHGMVLVRSPGSSAEEGPADHLADMLARAGVAVLRSAGDDTYRIGT